MAKLLKKRKTKGFNPNIAVVRGSFQKRIEARHFVFKKIIYLTLLINAATAIVVFLLQNNLPPDVPLFYGLPKTHEQLVTSVNLILPTVIASAILFFNLGLSLFLDDDYLKKTLVIASTFVTLFTSITTFKIIFLVGSF